MIDSRRHKKIRINKCSGLATLIVTTIMLVSITLLMLFGAGYGVLNQKTVANVDRYSQAVQAAEAGVEFGIAFLNTNSTTVLASTSGGYLTYTSASITNVPLANGSSFTVTYSNPTANDYSVVTVTASGVNADGTATEVVSQQVASTGGSALTYTMMTKGSFTASGGVTVTGPGLDVGGSMLTSGSNNISSSTTHDSDLASMTNTELFQSIFNMTEAAKKSASTVYNSTGSIPWSTLSGSVWINTTLVMSGAKVVGTPTNPVLLIVNGSFINSGSFTLYGVLYVIGNTTASGTLALHGGLVSTGSVTTSGSTSAYDANIVKILTGGNGNFVKIPGSWRDF